MPRSKTLGDDAIFVNPIRVLSIYAQIRSEKFQHRRKKKNEMSYGHVTST